jgi:hypothetical protein
MSEIEVIYHRGAARSTVVIAVSDVELAELGGPERDVLLAAGRLLARRLAAESRAREEEQHRAVVEAKFVAKARAQAAMHGVSLAQDGEVGVAGDED